MTERERAAQQRREVAKHGGARNFKAPNANVETTAADVGLTRKEIHEARAIRDAEKRDPGIEMAAISNLAKLTTRRSGRECKRRRARLGRQRG